MSILVNKNSRIIIQGFTGKEGSFHSEQMLAYGSSIVGGVTPGKGGEKHLGIPVFDTVEKAVRETNADVSVIFVPAAFAVDAIMEAAESNISLIVCITEGIPISDMIKVKRYLKKSRLIGPNCPGVITVGESKVGIMPGFIFERGTIGIVSKSGTLTYEAADQIVASGLGISTAVGVGGDPIIGSSMQEIVSLFMEDDETEVIVIIGEIGGKMEKDAAIGVREIGNKKPVIGFIAGQTAPKGRIMGHAGAIVGGEEDTAKSKIKIMIKCGIHIVVSPSEIGQKVLEIFRKIKSPRF
ncbi:MAG TPA: succinate--CoA ligase subunit alpha [Blattabacteriaceae bacterium]